jgi:hypothetical protein
LQIRTTKNCHAQIYGLQLIIAVFKDVLRIQAIRRKLVFAQFSGCCEVPALRYDVFAPVAGVEVRVQSWGCSGCYLAVKPWLVLHHRQIPAADRHPVDLGAILAALVVFLPMWTALCWSGLSSVQESRCLLGQYAVATTAKDCRRSFFRNLISAYPQ